jgi:MraZ protein
VAAFYGRHYLRVDEKGRVIVPSHFRDVMKRNGCGGILYVTCAMIDECLLIYPDHEWDRLMEKLSDKPRNSDAVKYFMRKVVGSAQECELDRQGRVLVPPSLRDDVGLAAGGEIVAVGVGEKVEIWSRAGFDKVIKPQAAQLDKFEEELAAMGI